MTDPLHTLAARHFGDDDTEFRVETIVSASSAEDALQKALENPESYQWVSLPA